MPRPVSASSVRSTAAWSGRACQQSDAAHCSVVDWGGVAGTGGRPSFPREQCGPWQGDGAGAGCNGVGIDCVPPCNPLAAGCP